MANPLSTALTWENLQTMVSNLTQQQSGILDPTLFTQLLNDVRITLEQEREWQVLKKYDTSLSWSPSDTFQTAHALPATFGRWCEDNPIQVWDGNTVNPTVMPLTLIPYDEQLWSYSEQFTAMVDYSAMNLYFCGLAGQNWTVILSYIQDNGDIVSAGSNGNVSTSWQGFPARFHKYLGYDTAARFRLGVNYDDMAVRNADDNGAVAERIKRAMSKWDGTLIRSQLKNRDYLPPDYPMFVSRKINIYP